MNKHYILNERREVVLADFMTWALWMERREHVVKQEYVRGYKVSTVFLGLDYNFSGGGAPVLWETMIFSDRGDADELHQSMDRCSGSIEQAEAMHEKMKERIP